MRSPCPEGERELVSRGESAPSPPLSPASRGRGRDAAQSARPAGATKQRRPRRLPARPEEQPPIRVEERPLVRQRGHELLAVGREELRSGRRIEPLLVVGEQRPAHLL